MVSSAFVFHEAAVTNIGRTIQFFTDSPFITFAILAAVCFCTELAAVKTGVNRAYIQAKATAEEDAVITLIVVSGYKYTVSLYFPGYS